MHYAAFISYSHQDQRWARWVHRSVERFRIPKRLRERQDSESEARRLRPVFRDREELATAASLSDKINEALAQSAALIVICSPAAAASRWVDQEILAYKRMHGEGAIYCLIVEGNPGSGDDTECFPPSLRFRIDQDGTLGNRPAEPIAADVRPGGDGRNLARLKIVAGLLNVGLDELRQRDQQRRTRRLAGMTAASIAGMALAALLALNAMLARDDARRRQRQAEDLIEFMLGDLKRELGKVGRLDALDAAARKAVDYFAQLPEKDLNDEALARRAEAFRAIGEIHMDRLEWDQALSINQLALQAVTELRQRNPDNLQLLYELAQSQFWVGYVYLESGRHEQAEAPLKEYLRLSQELLASRPDHPEWVMEVSYGHTNLAGLYDRQGRSAEAVAQALLGIEFNRRAAKLAPSDPFYSEELAGAWTWVGVAQMGAGMLEEAVSSRAEARQLYQAMYASSADNRSLQERLAAAWRGEARALNLLGRHKEALAALDVGLDHFRRLCEIDPSNELWRWWRQDGELNRIEILLDAGLAEQITQTELNSMADFSGSSYANDPYRESRRRLAGSLWAAWCTECGPAGDHRRALIQLAVEHPERTGVLQSLATAALSTQLLSSHTGLPPQNPPWPQDIRAQLSRLIINDPDPANLALLARLALLAGDAESAATVLPALRLTGYRTAAFLSECQAAGLCADW